MIERTAAEETAYLQQQCAEATLSCTGDAVLVCDNAGRVTYLNASAELMTGWSCEEARGHSSTEVLRTVETCHPATCQQSAGRQTFR